MARKNEKQNDKEIIEKNTPVGGGLDKKESVRVRFRNSYIGIYGIFYAGKEYDLNDGLYNLFKEEVEVI